MPALVFISDLYICSIKREGRSMGSNLHSDFIMNTSFAEAVVIFFVRGRSNLLKNSKNSWCSPFRSFFWTVTRRVLEIFEHSFTNSMVQFFLTIYPIPYTQSLMWVLLVFVLASPHPHAKSYLPPWCLCYRPLQILSYSKTLEPLPNVEH